MFTPGIDAFAQAAMGVVVIQRLGIAAVAVAEQLTARVPAQVLALFEGIGDLGGRLTRGISANFFDCLGFECGNLKSVCLLFNHCP